MAGFTITSINYANATGVSQTFQFEYKLWNDPDSAYILISSNSTVNTDGTLVTPLMVTGLDPSTVYYIRASNNCNSPLEYFITTVSTGNISFALASITNYGINYATSIDIIDAVLSVYDNSVTISYSGLPSFCTTSEGEWKANPQYEYIKYFKISVTPTGIGDSGTYNFSVTGFDGSTTIIKNYTLVVDNLSYTIFNRPFVQPTSRTITVGDMETWGYPSSASINSFSSYIPYGSWAESIAGSQYRVFAEPIAGEEGQGAIIASIRRTSISILYSDSILILTTVNPL